MAIDRLEQRPITPMKQSMEASCVPTSISMVFSGFGVDISEQTLVDKYFPSAGLPISAWDPDKGVEVGVSNTNTVRGIIQIIKDLGLTKSLQTDVFIPSLYEYTSSSEEKYIVQTKPRAIKRYGRIFEERSEVRGFYETLEQLVKEGGLGVYTANARMMGISRKFSVFSMVPEKIRREFYDELSDFIKKGHIIGPHGGMTMHTRALDGSRKERLAYQPDQEGYVIVDPRGESYAVSLHSLVYVDSMGVRGDTFDYLFRVSPRENELKPQTHGFRGFLQNLRDLIP